MRARARARGEREEASLATSGVQLGDSQFKGSKGTKATSGVQLGDSQFKGEQGG